jgi:hypothetical protein
MRYLVEVGGCCGSNMKLNKSEVEEWVGDKKGGGFRLENLDPF